MANDTLKVGNKISGTSIKGYVTFIIILMLFLTIFLNYKEVILLLKGEVVSHMKLETPYFIKMLKDVLIIMLISLLSLRFLIYRVLCKRRQAILMLFLIVLGCGSMIYSASYSSNYLLILFGLRWIFPILLVVLLIGIVDDNMQIKIASYIVPVFLVGFFLQVIELIFAKNWFGHNQLGLNLRNPGFYLIPISMSFFSAITMYYTYHFYKGKRRTTLLTMEALSIIIANSGTGFFVLALFVVSVIAKKIKPKVWALVLSLLIIFLLIGLLPKITNRADIYESFFLRAGSVTQEIKPEYFLLSKDFGKATATALLFSYNVSKDETPYFVADSMISSVVVNLGIFFLIIFIALVISVSDSSLKSAHFIMVFMIFALANNLFEVFPSNILFSVNMAYFIYKQNQQVAV